MKHTRAPWKLFIDGTFKGHIFAPHLGKDRPFIGSTFDTTNCDQIANAHRIVSTVNACEGISNEALEQGVIVDLLKSAELILDSFAYAPGCGPEWYEATRLAVAKSKQGA